MTPLVIAFLILMGFGAGVVISGGIFSFIAAIGVVPRLAQRTKTTEYIPLYEDAISVGGIFGAITLCTQMYLPIGKPLTVLLGFCAGVFFGCLALSLAEMINALPILLRRTHVTRGISLMIMSVAIGKILGSLAYFLIQGFYISE